MCKAFSTNSRRRRSVPWSSDLVKAPPYVIPGMVSTPCTWASLAGRKKGHEQIRNFAYPQWALELPSGSSSSSSQVGPRARAPKWDLELELPSGSSSSSSQAGARAPTAGMQSSVFSRGLFAGPQIQTPGKWLNNDLHSDTYDCQGCASVTIFCGVQAYKQHANTDLGLAYA